MAEMADVRVTKDALARPSSLSEPEPQAEPAKLPDPEPGFYAELHTGRLPGCEAPRSVIRKGP